MFKTAVMAEDRSWARNLLLVVGGALLMAVSGRISIPLPFTPVPIVLTSGVGLALGAVLGSRLGGLAILLYLVEGMMGLPVFALGKGGLSYLLGPTGGYLLGFLVATYLVGLLAERTTQFSSKKMFAILALSHLVIYALGVSYLSLMLGWKDAFLKGMAPFLIGDLLKLMMTTWGLKLYAERVPSL